MSRQLRWALGGIAVSVVTAALWVATPLPPKVANPGPVPSLELVDRYGVPLRTLRAPDGARGGWVAINEVDPRVMHAFVAIEDHRFFEHRGVDVRGVLRALRDNATSRSVVSGASTLTMQTARLLRGMNRGWTGKVAQALWAIRLEAHLTKSQILEIYLNRVPLGQGTVGVAAASALYFGASPTRLSLGQAALLAGTARSPSRTNPISSPSRAAARRNLVLARMTALGLADGSSAAVAAGEPTQALGLRQVFWAPHFTTHVVSELAGASHTGTVRTALDLDLQRAVESEVRHAVLSLERHGAQHASAVVLDNRTGGVLAWVGSPDFFADSVGQVDMVVSRRQPGSALKPFLYGLALDRGYTAATVLPDIPRTYATTTGPYRPRNYDREFRGPVRMRDALASSYNVPAVELAERMGAASFLGVLQQAGFQSLDRSADHYGLGLALGNGEVTLLELANAYRGLAAGGEFRHATVLLDPPGVGGRAGYAARPETGTRFMSQASAAIVLDILSDPVARIGGFGTETVLEFPFPVAAKTGTSRHFTDNWAVATTGATTVAVWVGNFGGNPMKSVSGISGAGPLLRRVVLETAERYPPGRLVPPRAAGAELHRICSLSGMKAHEACPSMLEWFTPGSAPTRIDDWQRAGRTRLPAEYAEWAASANTRMHAGPNVGTNPTSFASVAEGETVTPSAPEQLHILSPGHEDVYEVPPAVDARYATVPLIASSPGAQWFVDGTPATGARWRLQNGEHWITAMWPGGHLDSVRVVVR